MEDQVLMLINESDPMLHEETARIDYFNASLVKLGNELEDACRAYRGYAIAAPQVGVPVRATFILAERRNEEGKRVGGRKPGIFMVNPEITKTWGKKVMTEGCLSVPGRNGHVERAEKIEVVWQTLNGSRRKQRFTGLLAHIIQHEVDHLDGILYTDKLFTADEK